MLQLIATETLLPGYDSLISTDHAQLLDSEISTGRALLDQHVKPRGGNGDEEVSP